MVPKTEKRRFGMHANLLYDVITKQAGTLQKAILEGVMNGVDAGASRIEVVIDNDSVVISDDGRGFVDQNEIDTFFETFGTPHQAGDATYGRFRMGRGQLFAFGVNEWRTNRFRMNVDIRAKGLDYDLTVAGENAPGCTIAITLYKPLLPSERNQVEREISSWVAYVSVPVVINGRVVSRSPSEAKWTVETDDAWFNLAPSKTTMSIYNLGVLVMTVPANRYGTGGTVVSKERLEVNFARNDVQDDCSVFRRIRTELRRHSDTKVIRKKKVTDAERQHMADRFIEGTLSLAEMLSVPILTNVEGAHHPISSADIWRHQTRALLTAPRGSRQAIVVAQQHMAIALSEETLHRFGVESTEALVATLTAPLDAIASNPVTDPSNRNKARWTSESLHSFRIADLHEYDNVIMDSHEPVPTKKLNASQTMLLKIVRAGIRPIAKAMSLPERSLLAGKSDVSEAWTDGVENIWINVNRLAMISDGHRGCTRLAALLVHEFMHEGPDTETHDHDQEFYQRFHDAVIDSTIVGDSAAAMMKQMAYEAKWKGRQTTKAVSMFEDMEERIIREGGRGGLSTEDPLTDDLARTA